MTYLKDYKKSSLLKSNSFTSLVDKIFQLDLDEKVVVKLISDEELRKLRYNIYALLNSLGRKGDFILRKKKMGEIFILEIKPAKITLLESQILKEEV